MDISNFISTFGVILVAAFLVYKEYRSGNSGLNGQVVSNYKLLDEQQKEKIASQEQAIAQYQKEMHEVLKSMNEMKQKHAKDIGDLQGQITAKDKQIESLQKTILNRNPELENLLKEIRDFMEHIYELNKHQTTILEAGQVRNMKIDEATIKEVGHVLRKTEE